MLLTDTLYLNGEPCRSWIEVNPETVSLDCNNVQKAPLSVRFWMGEGSEKIALTVFLTLKVESVVGSSVTALYTYSSPAAVSSYSYTIPSNSYPTANRISVYAYEDAARTKEISSKQVNIVVENPVPFPRSEPWSTGLTYKNGEYLLLDDVIYMWGSRVPGNTSVSPKADLSSATPSGKWKSYQNWPLFATNIALIKFGLIGSAVFKDEFMYSQQGTNAAGTTTNDYTKFGTSAFTPYLMMDFERGIIETKKGVFRGSLMNPFSFISGSSMPTIGASGSNGIYIVSANSSLTIGMGSKEIKAVNGLSFALVVRISGSAPMSDRFGLVFSKDTDGTWPCCIIANGVTTSGTELWVSKSCVLSLLYVPKVLSVDGKIHRNADLCVLNYDSSFMTINNWNSSAFATPVPDSDIVEL